MNIEQPGCQLSVGCGREERHPDVECDTDKSSSSFYYEKCTQKDLWRENLKVYQNGHHRKIAFLPIAQGFTEDLLQD